MQKNCRKAVPPFLLEKSGRCGAPLEKLFSSPAGGGGGQATKRRESALLAGTIRGATCLEARGRALPSFLHKRKLQTTNGLRDFFFFEATVVDDKGLFKILRRLTIIIFTNQRQIYPIFFQIFPNFLTGLFRINCQQEVKSRLFFLNFCNFLQF